MTQPYTDYKYTKKVGAEANETSVFRFGTHPPVYQAATLFKNYKGCRDLLIRILPLAKISYSRHTETDQRKRDKRVIKKMGSS